MKRTKRLLARLMLSVMLFGVVSPPINVNAAGLDHEIITHKELEEVCDIIQDNLNANHDGYFTFIKAEFTSIADAYQIALGPEKVGELKNPEDVFDVVLEAKCKNNYTWCFTLSKQGEFKLYTPKDAAGVQVEIPVLPFSANPVPPNETFRKFIDNKNVSYGQWYNNVGKFKEVTEAWSTNVNNSSLDKDGKDAIQDIISSFYNDAEDDAGNDGSMKSRVGESKTLWLWNTEMTATVDSYAQLVIKNDDTGKSVAIIADTDPENENINPIPDFTDLKDGTIVDVTKTEDFEKAASDLLAVLEAGDADQLSLKELETGESVIEKACADTNNEFSSASQLSVYKLIQSYTDTSKPYNNPESAWLTAAGVSTPQEWVDVATTILDEVLTAVKDIIKNNPTTSNYLDKKTIPIFDASTMYYFSGENYSPIESYGSRKALALLDENDIPIGTEVSLDGKLSDIVDKIDSDLFQNTNDVSSLTYDSTTFARRFFYAIAGLYIESDISSVVTDCDHSDSTIPVIAEANHNKSTYLVGEIEVDVPKDGKVDFYRQSPDISTGLGILGSNPLYKNNDFLKSLTSAEVSDLPTSPHQYGYGMAWDMLHEYYIYATSVRLDLNAKFKNGDDLSAYKDIISQLFSVQQSLKHWIPALDTLWTYKVGDELSLEDLYKEEKLTPYTGEANIYDDNSFEEDLDKTSILGRFYTINSVYGIANIDKESVWNDTDVDLAGESLVQDYESDLYGYEDNVNKETLEVPEDDRYLDSGTIKQGSTLGSMESGYDSAGYATSAKAVSMSEYITTGMVYSSTYVPMKTNLYSPDTIANFDQEFRDEFFYKYGFMRKALLWDKSGTSVTDFFNANNKVTNVLEVVTLRDLMESNGNEIAFFVDDDFYNAEEAIDEGNSVLEERRLLNEGLAKYLTDYYDTAMLLVDWSTTIEEESTAADIFSAVNVDIGMLNALKNLWLPDSEKPTEQDLHKSIQEASELQKELKSNYNYDLSTVTIDQANEYADDLAVANTNSSMVSIDAELLKDGDFQTYSNKAQAYLRRCADHEYRVIDEDASINNDNVDTIVLPSSTITSYMEAKSSYQAEIEQDDGNIRVNTYTSYDTYTPMLSLSYVSALYRDSNAYSLANLVSNNNPVFLASKDVCSLDHCSQWYANTILNYAFVQNLKSSAQIDYTYVMDLDCPLYIDIFGNIQTESGTVVIPAACNMTLHNASYKDSAVAVGLYTIYGNEYYVPLETPGAAKAMFPMFTLDKEQGVYVINGQELNFGSGGKVAYNEIAPYEVKTQEAVMHAYKSYIRESSFTNLNWVALVQICNEVMRGAPIENIDKTIEGLNVSVEKNQAAVVAAVKLESLIDSLEGTISNTLISIPDFTRMDDMEYLIAFLTKMLMVATAAVIIIGVYRDGVSGELGLRTFWKSISSVALTFAAVCVIPAVFQLTYYAANKFLLQDEALRILMFNQEKYQAGIEIGMLETTVPESTTDMAIQLDWISVPWYGQLDNMLYGSTLQNLDETKRDAYLQSPIYDNYDVTLYNDGVYTTIDQLFSSVAVDYTFNTVAEDLTNTVSDMKNGLILSANNTLQTASFYSPYYAFLHALTGNVNEYNYYHDTYNYTTKYMSGNRLKTVGLCNTYFSSVSFMELDEDILHLYEIYDYTVPDTYDHGLFFTATQRDQFAASGWYARYPDETFYKRVELMNSYARDFIADNRDLMTKVTDETFIKTMALAMAIKHNQIFGIPYANAIEIYDMDSNDLLRLSVAPTDDAILNSPMSYSRYIYNLGGEPAVYAAAILTMIMWLGSFIKPLCTVIVFISVFLSIWVFRVVLRKPSANLWGYLVTCLLLCGTNILHAILLKVSTYLPRIGLPMLGCLLFIIFAQVVYLLVLAYVTGVSLKDWSNLGYTEYEKEARRIRRKLGKESTSDMLSGRVPHHQNNWDYYNDLVNQHRSRNA